MESWLQRILLARLLGVVILLAPLACFAQREADDNGGQNADRTILDAVIEPDLQRRRVDESKIDTENWEVGLYAGVMSVEDFGTNNVYGMRAAFHISEDWFLEGSSGGTEIGEATAETLFSVDIVGDDRMLDYYNLSIGVNLFPGETFLGSDYAFNSNVFLIVGAGNTLFAGDEFFTYNFGGGFRLFVTDWLAFRLDFRNHLFTHTVLGEEKSIQNLDTHVGLSLFF